MAVREPSKGAPFDAACLIDYVVITIGAESTNVINVGVVFKDPDGRTLSRRGCVSAYLSTDSGGGNLTSSAPSGGVAVGTSGLCIETITDKCFLLVSSAAGLIDLNITESGTPTFYLVFVMPDGRLQVSGAITFA